MSPQRGSRTPKSVRVSVKEVAPFLWFDDQAEEAASFYVSLFRGSKVLDRSRMADPLHPGATRVLIVSFQLAGQKFYALNGGPAFKPTAAFSIYVECGSQTVVDRLWNSLKRGGKEVQCGWLEDRFGVSWQIIPTRLPELLSDPNPERARRAMDAMMKMVKIDVAMLERAVRGG